MLFKDEGNAIDRVAFVSGYALYAFDIGEKAHFSLTKKGSVRLVLNLVKVVVYAEFQNTIEIDRHRNVIYDFSV